MVILDTGSTQYQLKQQNQEVTRDILFDNGRALNAGQKISLTLNRPQCATYSWHLLLQDVVGKQCTLTGFGDIVVTDETSINGDELMLVAYLVSHDTRGDL